MPFKTVQNSLNAGEFSPALDSRDDVGKYFNAVSKESNFISQAQGGAIKRSGGKWIAKAKGNSILWPFSFSASDSMVIEAGNLYMRFYKDSARVMSDSVTIIGITLTSGAVVSVEATTHLLTTGMQVRFSDIVGTTELNYVGLDNEYTVTRTDADNFTLDGTDGDDFTAWSSAGTVAAIYEIVSPYDDDEIFDVHRTPVADVVRLTHEDFLPYKLSRIADNSWTLAAIEPTTGPFLTANTTTTKSLKVNKQHAGTHTASGASTTVLTDSAAAWTINELAGLTIYNDTDSTSIAIISNTANTVTHATGTITWTQNDVYYIVEKYYIQSGTSLTMTATGHTPFVAAHVGSYWKLNHTRADNTATLISTTDGPAGDGVSDTIKTKGAFNLTVTGFASGAIVTLQRKVGDGDFQPFRKFTEATAYSGTETEDDVTYRVVETEANTTEVNFVAQGQISESILEVTAYTSPSIVTVEAITDVYFAYDEADNITSEWAEGAWSAVRYYPRTCTLHENRMYYGGSTYRPQDIWYSKTGEYDDMSAGAYDNDGGTISLNDSDVSQIEWMVGFQRLFVGTSKKEYMISAVNPTDPITPTDINAKVQSSYGSKHTQPVILNNGVFYAQRQGKRIRIITLNEYGDRQISDDATRFATHIFESAPTQFAVQNTPDSIVWAPRADGQGCTFVYDPAEEVISWSRCVTGSLSDAPVDPYKSFAIIPGSTEDQVWYVVNRVVDGTSVYYVEQIGPRIVDQLDEALMLDSAKVVESVYDSQNLVVASDTIRCGEGACSSGPCGGII